MLRSWEAIAEAASWEKLGRVLAALCLTSMARGESTKNKEKEMKIALIYKGNLSMACLQEILVVRVPLFFFANIWIFTPKPMLQRVAAWLARVNPQIRS